MIPSHLNVFIGLYTSNYGTAANYWNVRHVYMLRTSIQFEHPLSDPEGCQLSWLRNSIVPDHVC
ncbi:hypothetical protein T08_7506 [Trichinella sp. T8]|nr:hypothetical protein T08_7506 [Trichinella sp. T8]